MKNKVLLEIYIPATGQSLEMRVPRQLQIAKLEELLDAYLNGKNGAYLPREGVILCEPSTGKSYEQSACLAEMGFVDGSKLLLM